MLLPTRIHVFTLPLPFFCSQDLAVSVSFLFSIPLWRRYSRCDWVGSASCPTQGASDSGWVDWGCLPFSRRACLSRSNIWRARPSFSSSIAYRAIVRRTALFSTCGPYLARSSRRV
ncbi:hypothetical protein RSAG8_00031, partial [Rhizoctonia solani AG-8 WAC10335]